MSARSRGARTWLARSIIATEALALGLLLSPPPLASAATPFERLVAAVEAAAGTAVTPAGALASRCADDLLCAGRVLATELGPRAHLQRVSHPDSDTIRRVHSRASVVDQRLLGDGALYLKMDHFGRKAMEEIRDAFLDAGRGGTTPASMVLDLRANPGGDFDRMLRVAGLFTGAVESALVLSGPTGQRRVAIPAASWCLPEGVAVQVLIGERTASSAEILAALLKKHRHAPLVGTRTFGKTYLHRVVPLTQDWDLYVPSEHVVIEGIDMAGGLSPDRWRSAESGP